MSLEHHNFYVNINIHVYYEQMVMCPKIITLFRALLKQQVQHFCRHKTFLFRSQGTLKIPNDTFMYLTRPVLTTQNKCGIGVVLSLIPGCPYREVPMCIYIQIV